MEWWDKQLGVDRVRLLRILGMSEDEAKAKQSESWNTILQEEYWSERGWWLEGKLQGLLVLFDYDLKALAGQLHGPWNDQRDVCVSVVHPASDREKLQHTSNEAGTEVLLYNLARTGPESFSALIEYLSDRH